MRFAIMPAVLLVMFVALGAADDPPGQPKVKVFDGGEIPKGAKVVGLEPGKVTEPALRNELLAMVEDDQKGRRELMALHQKLQKGEDAELRKQTNELSEKLRAVDKKNTARMNAIIEKHGWPGKNMVGMDGAQSAFLMVQHADLDRDFQKHCLGLLKDATAKGEMPPTNLAYLTDRVLVGEGKKQSYGTQLVMVDGKMKPQPIEDEANVDKRRKDVGLPPLVDYVRIVEEHSKSPPEKS